MARRLKSAPERHQAKIAREDARMPDPIRAMLSGGTSVLEQRRVDEAANLVREVLGKGADRIMRIFDIMGVAEEEIAEREAGFSGEARARIHDAFRYLAPNELVSAATTDVYRHHVREILDRIDLGEDVRPATKAEVMVLISRASLEAPPTYEAGALMLDIFNEVFPKKRMPVEGHFAAVKASEKDELLAELRRKGARDRDVRRAS
jgi:hypothetical protein